MQTSRRPLRQVRRALLVASAFSASIVVLMLVVPAFALQLTESALPARSLELLAVLVGLATLTLLVVASLDYCRDLVLMRAALWLDHTTGAAVLEAGLAAGADGGVLRERAAALERLRRELAGGAVAALLELPWTIAVCAVLALLHPLLALACATVLLVQLAAVLVLVRPGLSPAQESAASRWLDVACRRTRQLSADGVATGLASRWELAHRRQVAQAYVAGCRDGLAKALTRSLGAAGVILVMAFGGSLVVSDGLQPGAVVAATLLVMRALSTFEIVLGAADRLREARRAWRALAAIDLGVPAALAPARARGLGAVRLEAVACAWPGQGHPVLSSIDLVVAPGECIGIVGPRGSGKSTLAALIGGVLEPSSGRATIDGESIARHCRGGGHAVGFVPDQPELIGGSVIDSITGLAPDDVEGATRAAIRAGAHDIIAALREGYETEVGEDGRALPMRARRAVALARAFYADPRLVVLDEPELALDESGIARLAAVLEEARRAGIGLVLATAEPRLLRLTDRIVLLSGGRVEAELPSRHLLAALSGQEGRRAA